MWRVGTEIDDKVKNGQAKKVKEPIKRRPSQRKTEKKPSMKMVSPGLEKTGKKKNGAVLATEHLVKRRTSRRFSRTDFTTFDSTTCFTPEYDSSPYEVGNISVATPRLTKIKQVQARINEVMKEYESAPPDQVTEGNILVKEIEDNLFDIEDDMLRINVLKLVRKFRKMSLQLHDQHDAEPLETNERNNELLKSIQHWMETDHFDDDDLNEVDDRRDSGGLSINETAANVLAQVEKDVKKIAVLKEKIREVKLIGDDASFLERQKVNLERQVRQDAMEGRHRHGAREDRDGEKQEFTYLKNAANEIYDLLRRTRMEGMATAHELEDTLHDIMDQLEKKDKDINFLEQRVQQQKRLVKQWYDDYEKLQNDHLLTKDELFASKKLNKQLEMDLGIRPPSEDDGEKELRQKRELQVKIKEYEEKIQHLRQNTEVLAYTVKEKESRIELLERQIQQLRSALRKTSGTSIESESSTRLSDSVPHRHRKSLGGEKKLSSKKSSVIFESSPLPEISNSKEQLDSFKIRIAALEKENRGLKSTIKELKQVERMSNTELTKKIDLSPIPAEASDENLRVKSPSELPRKEAKLPITLPPVEKSQPKLPPIVAPRVKVKSVATQTRPPLSVHDRSGVGATIGQRGSIGVQKSVTMQQGVAVQRKISKDAPSTASIDVTTKNQRPTATVKQEQEAVEQRKVDEPNVIRKSELMLCKVTDSVQKLTENMLKGQDPQFLENNIMNFNTMHTEMEDMLKNVSGFVNKTQALIGCQTGMMSEANDRLKKALPTSVADKLDKDRPHDSSQSNLSSLDPVRQENEMALTDTIRDKLRKAEESIREGVANVINVYISEITKQHAEYSGMHALLQEESTVDVAKLITDASAAMRDMQNKVETDVRTMVAETATERETIYPVTHWASSQPSGPHCNVRGNDVHVARQPGQLVSMLRQRHAQALQVHPDQDVSNLTIQGHGSTEDQIRMARKKQRRKKPVRQSRQTVRDYLSRIAESKTKMTEQKEGKNGDPVGFIIKSTAAQREGSTASLKALNSSVLFNPLFAGNLPPVQAQPRKSKRDSSRISNEFMTINELQNTLNIQISNQTQESRRSTIERILTPEEQVLAKELAKNQAKKATKRIDRPVNRRTTPRGFKLPKLS